MASTSIQLQDGASLSSGSSSWKYDVFLSFRGVDTRNSFVDHLYSVLDAKCIFTFKDDLRLERGEYISPTLLKAIEESRFAVVVFSKNYASSKWCLEELAYILECQKTRGLTILPVFYKVDPSDLRKQRGSIGKAFAKHERDSSKKKEKQKVQRWRNALTEAANISGWDTKTHRPEAELVRNIAIQILNALGDYGSSIPEDSVGLRPRMEKVISLMKLDLDDPRMVGICGMGGMGKTTIAKAVYNQICSLFDGRCYLANVRETSEKHGLESLQKSLLADIRSVSDSEIKIRNIDLPGTLRNAVQNKRVLVVLDDVDHLNQLDALVGRLDWFGRGSKIIITTRNNHLLAKYGPVYNVETLYYEEAFKLFCYNAFRNNQPTQDFEELTESFVCYAGGVPIALQVLGSFLFRRSIIEWRSAVDKLRQWPNADIQAVLKLSYDGLDHEEREIFLDIACFYKRLSKDYVIEILHACGFHAHIGISVLEGKALVTIRDNMIDMHDLVQEMGRHIVYEESPKESGGRSRLWNYEEICHTLTKKTGTEAVEAIVLNSYGRNEISLSPDAFSNMSKLRLLQLSYFQLPNGLDYLSSDLCCLTWWGYPLEYLPSNFQSNSLIKLNLSHSRLKQLWNGGMVTNLKELVLEGCTNLVEIDPSIEATKRLTVLNLRGCKNLKVLPTRWWLKSLKKLVLSDCSRLENISEVLASATECLVWLELDNTCVKELLVEHLINLESIKLRDCKELTSLSSGICGLKRLENLLVSGCSKLSKLPENIGGLESLLELRADLTAIKQLPFSIIHLKKLVYLSFQGCKGGVTSSLWNSQNSSCPIWKDSQDLMGFELPPLSGLSSLVTLILSDCIFSEGCLPNDLGSLSSLSYLNLSGSNIISLPDSIGGLGQLSYLNLSGCNIISLPDSIGGLGQLSYLNLSGSNIISLPDSIGGLGQLSYLNLSGCKIISLPDSIGGLGQLSTFHLSDSKIISLPDSIGDLGQLLCLNLSGSNIISLPDSIGGLDRLASLDLSGSNIISLPDSIGGLGQLSYLNLSGSNIISLPDSIGGLGQLSYLNLSGSNIISLPDSIGGLGQLSTFHLSDSKISSLPDSIGGLDQLLCLNLSDSNIISLPDSIGGLVRLASLDLSGSNIISLPDSIGRLDRLCIYFANCKKLKTVSYLPTCTDYLAASGCTSLETLPDPPMLSSFLRSAALSDCHTLVENRPSLLLELLRNNLKLLSLSDSVSPPPPDKVTCTEGFAFVVPGRDIPKCFSYQNDMGHYVRIHLMPDSYQRLRGFVLCAAFKAKAPSIGAKVSVEYYHMYNDDLVHASLTNICDFEFQSDHLFLCYLTREHLYKSYFTEIKNDRPEIIIFYFKSSSLMFAPTKCAVHMVYENEEVWPDLQTSIQQSSCDEFYENDEEWPDSHASIQRSSCDEFQWGDSQSELLETSIENIRAKFVNRLYRHDKCMMPGRNGWW
ncbi:disease resistance protein RPV1-like isoform X3 [Diospyros lotus]|uniref:disease resistance protein RPV1-like isoform X3 n=1 Tax=Diospyros lotus TaxID=55363 RepID=UPI0022539395|nr:disease resistance protein RPV1-like isoform X3 [Diospyros lotus]